MELSLKMTKKILIPGTLLITVAPLATIISCGAKEHLNNYGNHAYMYSKDIQDSSSNIKVNMDFTRDDIARVPMDVAGHFNAKMAVGGYGEKRRFYLKGNAESTHLGLDVFAPLGTPIYAPADSEVVSAIWRQSPSKDGFAHGTGGNVLIKTKIKDLPIDETLKEIVYMKYSEQTRYHNETKVRYFTVPKVRFVNDHGVYVAPTTIKYDVQQVTTILHPSDNVTTFKKISVVSNTEWDNYVNSYTPKVLHRAGHGYTTREELRDSPNYIYTSFMHLSRKTIKLFGDVQMYHKNTENWEVSKKIIEELKPQAIKKGQVIGYVGSKDENGGWSTHTHIEVFLPALVRSGIMNLDRIHQWFNHANAPLTSPRRRGLFARGNQIGKIANINAWTLQKGTMNPNNIYHFYNDKTRTVTVRA